VQEVTNDVCVCPKGTGDWLCATDLYTKCYVNITDPPLYEGCADKPDSAYYLYSVPGFSPCFFFDFTSTTPFNLKYELNCKSVNTTGEMATIDENEMTGYQYRDVVAPAKYNPFKYLSQNPDTKFAVMEAVEVNVKFEFFDMKYLS